MEIVTPILTPIYSWLSWEPNIRQTNLRILRVPRNGARPHLIRINTIEVASEGNVDIWMVHIPDFRAYWGTRDGFHQRDIARLPIEGHQAQPALNGSYTGWKGFALDLIPVSKKTEFCGDAFIAKLPTWELDERGAVYEDFPEGFVDSEFWGPMVEKMHDR